MGRLGKPSICQSLNLNLFHCQPILQIHQVYDYNEFVMAVR